MKTKERKFRIIGNTSSHFGDYVYHKFKIGSVVRIEVDDDSEMPLLTNGKIDQFVRYSDMEEITNRKPSLLSRIYTAIAGALFGSYHRDRYQDDER
jgi:hypothetical protein